MVREKVAFHLVVSDSSSDGPISVSPMLQRSQLTIKKITQLDTVAPQDEDQAKAITTLRTIMRKKNNTDTLQKTT